MEQRETDPEAGDNGAPHDSTPNATSPPGSSFTQPVSFRRQRASRACETCHVRKVRCDAVSMGMPCTNCVAFGINCMIPNPRRKRGTGQKQTPSRHEASDLNPPTDQTTSLPISGDGAGHNSQAQDPGRNDALPAAKGNAKSPRTFQYSRAPVAHHSDRGTPATTLTKAQAKKEEIDSSTFVDLVMKPQFTRAPITEAGRVAYLGESSNLTLLVHDRQGSTDVVHYPLPENIRGSRARMTELDHIEIDILNQRGAFLLPPRELCDELIEAYFGWIHPIMPIINRTRFMRQYRDPENPPSLLLLQAVLLAGSRVCSSAQLVDANGSTTPAALTFYKRAKALYDANYEDDRVTIVQSLLLMGSVAMFFKFPEMLSRPPAESKLTEFCRSSAHIDGEGPEDSTANTFYYSRVATIVAQGSGMHRSVEQSQLSQADKRLWKRIWWTLFTRDRSVAVALGRPVHINLDDSDVEMLNEDDFIEDELNTPSEFPPNPVHIQFFLQYVKLCEIMGLVLSQQYSVASKGRPRTAMDLTHSDVALADWLRNCPKLVYWEMPCHHFWSALLHSNYYTILCLLHRAHMPPQGSSNPLDDSVYPSRDIAFQAAAMITSIIENLSAHDQLRYCPAFIVYSLFSALIMHVYQMRSPVLSIQQVTRDRIRTCMQALKRVSGVWLVGKMVHTLFESILGNKGMEERLQKAAGRRHKKSQPTLLRLEQQQQQQNLQHQLQPPAALQQRNQLSELDQQLQPSLPDISHQPHQLQPQQHGLSMSPQSQQQPSAATARSKETKLFEGTKRKYDDMAVDFSINAPTPKESYERSRPQSPSMSMRVTSTQLASNRSLQESSMNQNADTFMGGSASRPATRPATPFNPSFSLPTTPPDLYLVTRNSPNLSQSIWENFQPDQLFPESANLLSQFLGNPMPTVVSPSGDLQNLMSYDQGMGSVHSASMNPETTSAFEQTQSTMRTTDGPSEASGTFNEQSPDSRSTGSASGPTVPATLNVEDWYNFFGMNGDMMSLYPDMPVS